MRKKPRKRISNFVDWRNEPPFFDIGHPLIQSQLLIKGNVNFSGFSNAILMQV